MLYISSTGMCMRKQCIPFHTDSYKLAVYNNNLKVTCIHKVHTWRKLSTFELEASLKLHDAVFNKNRSFKYPYLKVRFTLIPEGFNP
jgi:hypothetical protein